MKIRIPLLVFQILILIALLVAVRAPARAEHACAGGPAAIPDMARFVVGGDSLSAGFQNGSLHQDQQPNGFANLIARQACTGLVLPLIGAPGIPNRLIINGFDPLVIEPEDGSWGEESQDGSDASAGDGQERDLGTAAVALVEDIQDAPDAGVGFMDYVFPEQKIALGATGVIVLAHLDTCLVETIKGGTVTVSRAGSEVADGSREAANVNCRVAKPIITAENREAGAVVNRVIVFDGVDWSEQVIKTGRPSWRATRWFSPTATADAIRAILLGR